jgi:hypothetical protein
MKDLISQTYVILLSLLKPNPLLTFNEVTTLFHEFGHGLHGMLANTTYPAYLEPRYIGILSNYQVR